MIIPASFSAKTGSGAAPANPDDFGFNLPSTALFRGGFFAPIFFK
jgi:hypothetical protein